MPLSKLLYHPFQFQRPLVLAPHSSFPSSCNLALLLFIFSTAIPWIESLCLSWLASFYRPILCAECEKLSDKRSFKCNVAVKVFRITYCKNPVWWHFPYIRPSDEPSYIIYLHMHNDLLDFESSCSLMAMQTPIIMAKLKSHAQHQIYRTTNKVPSTLSHVHSGGMHNWYRRSSMYTRLKSTLWLTPSLSFLLNKLQIEYAAIVTFCNVVDTAGDVYSFNSSHYTRMHLCSPDASLYTIIDLCPILEQTVEVQQPLLDMITSRFKDLSD